MTSEHVFDSDHQPQGSQPEAAGGEIPLAAGMHTDGTLHIYVYGKDSGLQITLDGKDGLIVHIDESVRLSAKRGKA